MGNFNSMIFPAPNPPFYNEKHPNLIWIPRSKSANSKGTSNSCSVSKDKKLTNIPCLFIPCSHNTEKLMIYFHGNAEDIGVSDSFFRPLTSIWNCHVLVMEYPTYGVYKNRELSEQAIQEDAFDVYNYITEQVGLSHEQIIVFGRSMGSGSACALASRKPVAGLILFSAYKSVKEAAKSLVGGFLSAFVKERFKNITAIEKVQCPVLFIHGKKDKVIPYNHTVALHSKCKTAKTLVTPSEMTHNNFRIDEDMIEPILQFMAEHNMN
jgi:pimeloyl-ACP methyl ester carboxylesterase